MSSWYQTEKGWRRRKSSIYLRENVYAELVKVADRNKLSFSETANRLLEHGLKVIARYCLKKII